MFFSVFAAVDFCVRFCCSGSFVVGLGFYFFFFLFFIFIYPPTDWREGYFFYGLNGNAGLEGGKMGYLCF